jgi:hypothetical protein
MAGRQGVILLDNREVIFRIYETSENEWKLYHYYHVSIDDATTKTFEATDILEIIGEFFSTEYAQHIAEWKTCCRYVPIKIVKELSEVLNIKVENISLQREQELLCKGMFTELW